MKRGVNPKICWSKFLPYQTILHTIQGHFYLGEKIRQLIVATTFTCQAFCWGSTHTLIVPKLFLSPYDVYTTWKWWILISKLLTINVVFVYFQNIYKKNLNQVSSARARLKIYFFLLISFRYCLKLALVCSKLWDSIVLFVSIPLNILINTE